MNEKRLQNPLAERIRYLCWQKDMSYYDLSYKSAVPITTLMHIIDGSTKNPGIFTIIKICSGLEITLIEFFDTEEFREIEFWPE
ncbi:MAG: XRE family transcriptional regulator [Eubacteriales bacterium]|nr:XRE family transcriptional regulator [Eubacteriales bacterium]